MLSYLLIEFLLKEACKNVLAVPFGASEKQHATFIHIYHKAKALKHFSLNTVANYICSQASTPSLFEGLNKKYSIYYVA